MFQSWREDHLDVSEHMYSKIELLRSSFDTRTAETVADVLFEIGKDLSSRRDYPVGVKWLDRARETIYCADVEKLSRDGVELRVAVIQALVVALLGLNTLEASERARSLVHDMGAELGEKPVVLLLELELLNKSPAEIFDANTYADVLRRMIRSFKFSGSSFKLAVHHIRRLHEKSPGLGCRMLDELLLALCHCESNDWIEKLVTTRIWMTTTQRDAAEPIEEAEKVLSKLDHQLHPDAIIACQAVRESRGSRIYRFMLIVI